MFHWFRLFRRCRWHFAWLVVPAPILERLSREVARAAALPEVRQTLQDIGIEARASTSAETRQRMANDIARWRKVIEQARIERQ